MEQAKQITALMLIRVQDWYELSEMLEGKHINALCKWRGLRLEKHAASFVDVVLGGGHLRLNWHVVLMRMSFGRTMTEDARA